jgi:hypothetical protein
MLRLATFRSLASLSCGAIDAGFLADKRQLEQSQHSVGLRGHFVMPLRRGHRLRLTLCGVNSSTSGRLADKHRDARIFFCYCAYNRVNAVAVAGRFCAFEYIERQNILTAGD